MGKKKLTSLVTCFTPDAQHLAILSPHSKSVKIWETRSGNLRVEWKMDGGDDVSYSCMACSFVGKKRKKESSMCILALGSVDGDIVAVDILTGEKKWKSSECHPGGIAGISFASRGKVLRVVGLNGMASELNSETGEVKRNYKVSKKPITSVAFSHDGKLLAASGSKLRVINSEDGNEHLKFPDDASHVQHISIADDAKTIVTSKLEESNIQIWDCDFGQGTVSVGPILNLKHRPLVLQCNNVGDGDAKLVVLAITESGAAYVWNMEDMSVQDVSPTKIIIKDNDAEKDVNNNRSARRSRTFVIAAKLLPSDTPEQLAALIAYNSLDSPKFSKVDISKPGKTIVISTEKTESMSENEDLAIEGSTDQNMEIEAVKNQNKKANKKRSACDLDQFSGEDPYKTGDNEVKDGPLDGDLDEETMGEIIAREETERSNLSDDNKTHSHKDQVNSLQPPSADSVHVLLKQALHADDRALLLDCLYTQNEKVIANSVSLLNPADVLKLLHSLISIMQSRGAVLACALPWLRYLLLQHASGIISQESSLLALNSLYQLIESRVSTLHSALQLSSCLDVLYKGVVDEEVEDDDTIVPIIYEDKDTSDEEESEDAMETDHDSDRDEGFGEALDGASDIEESFDMSE